jgi:hypothetical protein
MPCSVSQDEIDYYEREYRSELERKGRYDCLATRDQLAGWLCDSMRGAKPTPEAIRWFRVHRAHEGKGCT